MIRWHQAAALLTILLPEAPTPAIGQAVPFSQHATVSQRVLVTDILVEYNRPVARGRKLFGPGALVPPGRVWNPGADSASRIVFSRDVEVEGHALPAGRYSLWLQPSATGPWTLILNRAVDVYHTPYPGDATEALRTTVVPEEGGPIEALAFYFPIVAADSAILRMHWGTTIVPIRIRAPARE